MLRVGVLAVVQRLPERPTGLREHLEPLDVQDRLRREDHRKLEKDDFLHANGGAAAIDDPADGVRAVPTALQRNGVDASTVQINGVASRAFENRSGQACRSRLNRAAKASCSILRLRRSRSNIAPWSARLYPSITQPTDSNRGYSEKLAAFHLEASALDRALKCNAATDCSRAAASSGVKSRCGDPSSSKPTMNFRTVADRRSGGKKCACRCERDGALPRIGC